MGSTTGEKPYSIKEVAQFTGWSVQTVTRIFEHEPGVLVYESKASMGRKTYRSIRIPRHVYRRVIQKRTVRS